MRKSLLLSGLIMAALLLCCAMLATAETVETKVAHPCDRCRIMVLAGAAHMRLDEVGYSRKNRAYRFRRRSSVSNTVRRRDLPFGSGPLPK